MFRLILFAAVLLAVLYLIDFCLRLLRQKLDELGSGRGQPGRRASVGARAGDAPGARTGGKLVACRTCGVHVAESRALWLPGRTSSDPYCSEVCRGRAKAAS